MEKITYEDLINYLKSNIELLDELVQAVNSYNGALEDYTWYDNDEYFYEDFFNSKDEVARAVYYGRNNYNYMDEYIRFDAYGNLETTDEWRVNEDLIDGAEEILDEFLELYADDNVNTCDEVFKGMISDYYNTEEREEDK